MARVNDSVSPSVASAISVAANNGDRRLFTLRFSAAATSLARWERMSGSLSRYEDAMREASPAVTMSPTRRHERQPVHPSSTVGPGGTAMTTGRGNRVDGLDRPRHHPPGVSRNGRHTDPPRHRAAGTLTGAAPGSLSPTTLPSPARRSDR